MTQSWKEYWNSQSAGINQGLTDWRTKCQSRVQLFGLRKQSSREDLHGCVSVTIHGASKGGGQRHKLALAQVVAPLLKEGERVRLCIHEDGLDDFLEFFNED